MDDALPRGNLIILFQLIYSLNIKRKLYCSTYVFKLFAALFVFVYCRFIIYTNKLKAF